jgi:membrane associated rhomboid family serine protease
MRRPGLPFWSATTVLLAVNVGVFILQLVVQGVSNFPLGRYFALSLDGLKHGYVWQLLTFQFMHAGVIHLLLNGWGLYLFGRELEEALGRKSFLTLYFSSGVLGGLVQMAGAAFVPLLTSSDWASQFAGYTVGASAGVFGLIAAYAMLAPDREFYLLLFFVIPVRIRAWYLLIFLGATALFGVIWPSQNVANAAHIGGMVAGMLYMRYATRWQWPEFGRGDSEAPRRLVKVHPRSSALWSQNEAAAHEQEVPSAEFLSREVDPILDKISAHGIQSLTERERKILESARQKMGKR